MSFVRGSMRAHACAYAAAGRELNAMPPDVSRFHLIRRARIVATADAYAFRSALVLRMSTGRSGASVCTRAVDGGGGGGGTGP